MVREGKDVTILTYSRMRHHCTQALKEIEKQGYDPEIIDLISLKPFDMETISESVRKNSQGNHRRRMYENWWYCC